MAPSVGGQASETPMNTATKTHIHDLIATTRKRENALLLLDGTEAGRVASLGAWSDAEQVQWDTDMANAGIDARAIVSHVIHGSGWRLVA